MEGPEGVVMELVDLGHWLDRIRSKVTFIGLHRGFVVVAEQRSETIRTRRI